MSDIDFEELDKAVNSLVGGSPKDEKKEQTSESNEAPKPVESVPKPEAIPTSPNLPSRRAGRFMDMKHDSSDMTKDSSPSLMTSTKTTIAPISKDIKAEPKSDTTASEKTSKNHWSESKEAGSDVDEKDDNTTPPDTNMPDPIDHFESKQKETDDKSGDSPKEDNNTPDKSDEPELKFEETDNKRDEDEKDDKKPSPFIDDAKVEKRPLGGFSSESPVDPPKSDEKGKDGEEGLTKDGEEKPAAPIELPPELDKNLVAIEAGEAPETVKTPESPSPDIPAPDTDEEKEEASEEDAKDSKKDEPKKDPKHEVSQLLASASSGSIPDQYKRENRSHELHGDHPLFDSEHLKAIPTSAPKKPKSTAAKVFQWIFIALGLLLLGGSLGAAIFVFVSQS